MSDRRLHAGELHQPLFARVYDRLTGLMEPELGRHRDELLDRVRGRVVDVGAGNGIGLRHYPAAVQEVVAVEPEPFLRAKAQEAARTAPVPVTVCAGLAEALPFEDDSFDAAVVSLVLCTVRDQQRALSELARVVKPGGELRFLEHVRSDRPRRARVQQAIDRSGVWPRLAGGCHCARDTLAAVERAGFVIERACEFDLGPGWVITNPYVRGLARAPG